MSAAFRLEACSGRQWRNPRSRATGPYFPELSALVGGDRFHQGNKLALYRLILDLAVGAQQPQRERAVKKQQAFHFPRLAVAIVKEGDRHIERDGNLLETGGSDPVYALLVFLDLLKTDAELLAELRLRNLLFHTPQSNPLAKLDVGLAGTALLHLLRY